MGGMGQGSRKKGGWMGMGGEGIGRWEGKWKVRREGEREGEGEENRRWGG